jgi:hypothetical protein
VRREAGKAFTNREKDPNIKIHLLLGGEKMVNKALRQALKLQDVFLAARSPKTNTESFWETCPHPNQKMGPNTIRMLELWEAMAIPG